MRLPTRCAGCGSLSVCGPPVTVTRRGSRRDCPARSSNAHLAVHIGTSTGGSSTWSRSSSGSIPTSCRPRSRSSTSTRSCSARVGSPPTGPATPRCGSTSKAWPDRVWAVEGSQRRRPAAGAATPRGRRAGRRRPGQARRPGPAVRHRPQPQDRRPRRALDRGRRGPHQDPAGAAGRRRARGAADAHRPPRSTDPAPGPDRRPAPGAARRTPSWTGQTRHHHRPGQGDAGLASGRATSPARPAAASPPRSWPSWSRSRPRSRRPPPSSRPSCSPAARA